MERRTFLTLSGTALTALASDRADGATSAIAQARDGKPVGEDLVTLLENNTHQLADLGAEQRQHTITPVDAHLSTVTDLLAHGRYTPTVGLRHTLAASLAQGIAWHRFDLGRHTHASQYWIAALGRPLAAQHERRMALRALAAAEQHLSAADTDRPAWCVEISEADLAVDSGQTLFDLGDTARAHQLVSSSAHQLISEGERLLPAARDKTRGVFLAYRAPSLLDQAEPEPAAATESESLLPVRHLGAPRCIKLVDDLLPDTLGVPDLLQLAAA